MWSYIICIIVAVFACYIKGKSERESSIENIEITVTEGDECEDNAKCKDLSMHEKTNETMICRQCGGNLREEGNVYVCEVCFATYSYGEVHPN